MRRREATVGGSGEDRIGPGDSRPADLAWLALGLTLWCAAAAGAEEQRAFLKSDERREFLATLERRMSKVRSLEAAFEQEKTLKLFKDTARSSGVIYFSSPDRVRWEIRAPFRSILVVAGSAVGKFEYVGGKRRALQMGKGGQAVLVVMDQIRSWFRGRFGRGYELEVSRKPVPLVVLRPNDTRLKKLLRAIEVEIAADLATVSRVTLLGADGDRTVMRFKELSRNRSFPSGTFSVKDPREIEPRGETGSTNGDN